MAGKIFISYRRGDDPGTTGRLFDRLASEFTPEQVFLDVDNIPPGYDFVRVLKERVGECDVLLAIIGKGWLDARDGKGTRRLHDPRDFVRIEIETALNQDKLVIPVLVDGAAMPRAEDLPEGLQPLTGRNGINLTNAGFRSDSERLIKSLRLSFEELANRRRQQGVNSRTAAQNADAKNSSTSIATAYQNMFQAAIALRPYAEGLRQRALAKIGSLKISPREHFNDFKPLDDGADRIIELVRNAAPVVANQDRKTLERVAGEMQEGVNRMRALSEKLSTKYKLYPTADEILASIRKITGPSQ